MTIIMIFALSGCVRVVTRPADTADAASSVPVRGDALTEDIHNDLVPDGDFSEGNTFWGLYTQSGGSASFEVAQGNLIVKISDPGRVGHAVQIYCDGFELLEGGRYHFSADISSDVQRTFEWRVQLNGGDYHAYNKMEDILIGPEMTTITADFTMNEPSDPAPRMCFNLGDEGSAQQLAAHTVRLDNVSLTLENDTGAKPVEKEGVLADVNVNQIGYRPDDEKRAVIRNISAGDDTFYVIDVSDGNKVYTGNIEKGITYGTTGDKVGYAVFSDITVPGRYKVITSRSGESYEFAIENGVYDEALKDAVRMLYLQRCGEELPGSLAGDFSHKACHTEDAKIYGGDDYVNVTGGWHDAGDYGRYSVPAAKAVADLLLAYEDRPDAFVETLNIPESGNGVPDVLNEARYELEWLHKMQGEDGGVHHKVTGLNFDGFVKADECTEPLYLMPKSKTATADFAGVMYMAARVYKEFDEGFADKCQSAADRALDHYIEHIEDRNYTDPEDVNTGEYIDGCSVDEFLWAICEGYKTTCDERFADLLKLVDTERLITDGLGWADMSGYAFYAYLTADKPLSWSFDVRNRFFEFCDEQRDTALSGESYGGTIKDDYPWGSNMTIANNGMALLMAYKLTGNEDYRLAAKRQLDYLFGVNTNSYCFLTGYGTQSPEHPHHRPSQAVGKCMKGMLVGGPDSFLEDVYAKATLAGLPKARCYVDNEQSYSCNEITIYWNSPLVYLLAWLK